MTATVQLSDQELADLQSLTRQQDATAALRAAMQEYIRYAKRMRLKSMAGKLDIDDNWQQLEERELREQDESGFAGPD